MSPHTQPHTQLGGSCVWGHSVGVPRADVEVQGFSGSLTTPESQRGGRLGSQRVRWTDPRPCWGHLGPQVGTSRRQVALTAGGAGGMTGKQGPDDPAGEVEGCGWCCSWTCPTFGRLLYPASGIFQAQEEEGQPRADGTSARSQVPLSLLAATAETDAGWIRNSLGGRKQTDSLWRQFPLDLALRNRL